MSDRKQIKRCETNLDCNIICYTNSMIDYVFAILCLGIIGGLLWITEPNNKYASKIFKNRK